MKLLLDTHTFIWWDSEPQQLSARVRAQIEDPANELVFSVATVWEMQIKVQLGKLKLKVALPELLATQQQTNRLQILPIMLAHVLELGKLPAHHKDPFDRLLIAQAVSESATLVSHDPVFQRYSVSLLW